LSDLFFNKEKLLDVYETNFVNAAFWLLSKNCLNTVGGFDPIFYIYGEDDYINRVIGHNLKIGICPKLIGYHDRPQNSSDNLNINKLNAKELLFAKTELPPKKYFLFKYLFYLIFSIFHYDDSNKGKLKILLRIFKDYKTIQQHHNLSKKNGLTFL
jgi:GT2 family glycosyltransferase